MIFYISPLLQVSYPLYVCLPYLTLFLLIPMQNYTLCISDIIVIPGCRTHFTSLPAVRSSLQSADRVNPCGQSLLFAAILIKVSLGKFAPAYRAPHELLNRRVFGDVSSHS